MSNHKQQILPPAAEFRNGRADPSANSRAVVVADGRIQAGVRDALFVHIGAENTAVGGSAGFVAQHLDQEWMHRKPRIDTRRGISAYRRAGNRRARRTDLVDRI